MTSVLEMVGHQVALHKACGSEKSAKMWASAGATITALHALCAHLAGEDNKQKRAEMLAKALLILEVDWDAEPDKSAGPP